MPGILNKPSDREKPPNQGPIPDCEAQVLFTGLEEGYAGLSPGGRSRLAVKILFALSQHPDDVRAYQAIHRLCGKMEGFFPGERVRDAAGFAWTRQDGSPAESTQVSEYHKILDLVQAHDVIPVTARENMSPEQRRLAMGDMLERIRQFSNNDALQKAIASLAGLTSVTRHQFTREQVDLLERAERDKA